MAEKNRIARIKALQLDTSKPDPNVLVSGPKLRRMLDISPVTLWRWRHDKSMGFPTARSINGRLYFPWHEVFAWLESQQQAV
jgi:predicted DNA-binding transcriptional regulator AlpA